MVLVAGVRDEDAVSLAERGFDRVGEAGTLALLEDDAIDDDVDVVLRLLVEPREALAQVDDAPVDAHADVAALLRLLHEVEVLALARPRARREDDELGALGHVEQRRHDLLGGLRPHALAAHVAVLNARAR